MNKNNHNLIITGGSEGVYHVQYYSWIKLVGTGQEQIGQESEILFTGTEEECMNWIDGYLPV